MATQMYSAQSSSPTPIPKPEIRSRGLLQFNLGILVMNETADIRLLTIAFNFGAADAVAPQSNMPTLGDAVCTPVPVISMASETSRPPRKRSDA